MLFMDRALGRRLERAEAATGASFVETRQRLAAEVGAVWRDFDGTYAMFDGAESPMTQTFGLGLFAPVTADGLAAIEAFYRERGADSQHEVSTLAGIGAFALLSERDYHPVELSTVLVRPLADALDIAAGAGLRVRRCEDADTAGWIEASILGWSETPEVANVIGAIARTVVVNPLMHHFLVERDGAAIATGSLVIHDRVALLAGASTIPSGRGLGAQGMLLGARIGEARQRGCDLAMVVAEPGSTSQRNAERRGFRVAYTRTKWRQKRAT